jgi:hypothetical protein
MPAAGIARVSDDEHGLLLSNKVRLRGSTPLVVRIPVVRHPLNLGWRPLKVHRLPSLQQSPYLQEPLPEGFGTSVAPAPRRTECSYCWEPSFNVTLPLNELVSREPEDGLHWVTQNRCRQHRRQCVNDGVLNQVAVLVFVNDQAGVGRSQWVAHMAGLQEVSGGSSNGRVVVPGVAYFKNARVVAAPEWK